MQNNLKVQKVQSWSELFPPEAVEEFDLSTPEKRSEYFMQLWNDWAETQIDLSKYQGMDIKFIGTHQVQYEAGAKQMT